MVLGNEAPIAGIERVVTIVTHHPVVVQIEGVSVRLLPVDVDAVRLLFQCVAFISYDATFVNGQVIFVQGNGRTFFPVSRLDRNYPVSTLYRGFADTFVLKGFPVP